MRKSIKTTIFATVFFIGYAVGFLACGAAYAKGSSTLLRKAAYGVPVFFGDQLKSFETPAFSHWDSSWEPHTARDAGSHLWLIFAEQMC